MTDRNVQWPNRYQLTKVPGTDDIYDLTPAPGTITEEGTMINKATLLSDETAELLGLPNTAVPDDAFGALGSRAPVGSILWYTGENVPTGYLLCDGSAVSRTDYADLFSVVGTTFGAGDGSTTFNLPDLRAKFIRGAGANNGYTASFGQTQEATAAITGNPTAVLFTNIDKSTSSGKARFLSNASSDTNRTAYYFRPYNVALTPIIKY